MISYLTHACKHYLAAVYFSSVLTCHTRNSFMALFQDYPCELLPEEIFSWTFWCKRRYQRQTVWLGTTPSGPVTQRPTSLIPPFLRRMPFLPQPSKFILAWDRYQICWFAYPVAWL